MAEKITSSMAVPPHSLEAEKSVLGAMIQDSSAVTVAVGTLVADDFYAPANREIFSVMHDLYTSKKPVDLVTVDTELSRRGTLEGIGGTAYLIEMSQYVPTTANIMAYLSIVIEKSKLRQLISVSRDISAEAYAGITQPDELRDKMILRIKEVKTSDAPKLISMESALESLLDRISEINRAPEDGRIATGIPSLDKIIRIAAGKVIVIAARPSVGKSSFALQIARNASSKGKRTLLSSLEMTEEETAARILATLSGVPTGNIETGNLTDEDYVRIGSMCGEVAAMSIMSTDECTTISKLRRAAYSMSQDRGLDMIIVDYIQLMTSENKKANRNEQISEISRELKLLAKELKIPIVVLSQMNRQSQGGMTKDGRKIRRAPTMAEARDSGAIEQDADVFLILHDPEDWELRSPEDLEIYEQLKAHGYQLIWIIIEKNRNGRRKCTVATSFEGSRVQFTAITRKELPHG